VPACRPVYSATDATSGSIVLCRAPDGRSLPRRGPPAASGVPGHGGPKPASSIACGEVRVSFVARRNAADVPTVSFKTPRGYLAVSTPEATAFDLVGYPQHSGGVDNVATVLAELAEQLDPAALASLAPLSPVPWAQRLGFLLERIGAADRAIQLARHVAGVVNETTALVPSAPVEGAPYDKRWRLLINVQVEPDL